MSALGVGVSDREPVTIFNNPPYRRHFSQLEIDLQEAKMEAEYGWRQYVHNVDKWLDAKDYETMDKAGDICEALDAKVELLLKQLHCVHHNTHEEGSHRFVGGNDIDDTHEVCDDCQLDHVLSHVSNIPVNIVEIP